MKIAFDKVNTTPKPFSLEYQKARMEGALRKKSMHRIELSAGISGGIDLDCDRCGRSYYQGLDESLMIQIADEVAQNKEDLDIIEFLDGVIDVTYILESEINALAGDYHFCPECAQDDAPLEMEF